MKTYTLFWQTGKSETLRGNSPETAMILAGYGGGAIRALDFWIEGDLKKDYEWNSESRAWKRIINQP